MIKIIKRSCGAAAYKVCSRRTAALMDCQVAPRSFLDQLITQEIIRKTAANGNHTQLRSQLANHWQGSTADNYYSSFVSRFDDWFLGPHYKVVEELKSIVESAPSDYQNLYEIGCGDGQVIVHYAEVLPSISKLTGLDINASIIQRNQQHYKDGRLEFVTCDATKWLTENTDHNVIVTSYGGVLEYFHEDELKEMFAMLKRKSPVAVALVEPLYDDFDLENETTSRSGGQECSFSHNYRHLLEEAGLNVVFHEEIKEEFRWVMLLATA